MQINALNVTIPKALNPMEMEDVNALLDIGSIPQAIYAKHVQQVLPVVPNANKTVNAHRVLKKKEPHKKTELCVNADLILMKI